MEAATIRVYACWDKGLAYILGSDRPCPPIGSGLASRNKKANSRSDWIFEIWRSIRNPTAPHNRKTRHFSPDAAATPRHLISTNDRAPKWRPSVPTLQYHPAALVSIIFK
ncbi:unnamed protein product [Mesocestoides corti]|nr:unnamed protein product [Mesocestoides corti]